MMSEIYLYNLDLNVWDNEEEIDDDQNKLMTTMVVFYVFFLFLHDGVFFYDNGNRCSTIFSIRSGPG